MPRKRQSAAAKPPPDAPPELHPDDAAGRGGREEEAVTWRAMQAVEERLLRRLRAETAAHVQGLIADDLDIYNAHGAAACAGGRLRAPARGACCAS
jgi:hypothetical protein